MKSQFLTVFVTLFILAFTANAGNHQKEGSGKPGKIEIQSMKVDAVVEAVDYEKRDVTLKGPKGISYTLNVGEAARNLDQVEVGDTVTIQMVEAVNIQVFGADEVQPGTAAGTVVERAGLGDKPGAVLVNNLVVVATIEAINLDYNLATLKSEQGELFTVEVEEAENLKKIKVGDRVMITYTDAIAIDVHK